MAGLVVALAVEMKGRADERVRAREVVGMAAGVGVAVEVVLARAARARVEVVAASATAAKEAARPR